MQLPSWEQVQPELHRLKSIGDGAMPISGGLPARLEGLRSKLAQAAAIHGAVVSPRNVPVGDGAAGRLLRTMIDTRKCSTSMRA